MQGNDKNLRERALANDLGRLVQGLGSIMTKGTDTTFFMNPSQTPKDKKITYARLVSSIRTLKSEKYRVRVTIGGDHL